MCLKTVAYKGDYRATIGLDIERKIERWLLQTLQTAEKLKVNTPLS